MGARFWTSSAATWRLARFAVLALLTFFALRGFVDVLFATVVGAVVATLSLIDEVLSRRTVVSDRSSGASA